MAVHRQDLELCLQGLRDRGWDVRERDVFALLLQKVATAFLVTDDGSGHTVPAALRILREAETNLVIHCGTMRGSGAHQCDECGKIYADEKDLEAHKQRRHSDGGDEGAGSDERLDVAPKRF